MFFQNFVLQQETKKYFGPKLKYTKIRRRLFINVIICLNKFIIKSWLKNLNYRQTEKIYNPNFLPQSLFVKSTQR
jgi:hypothetical protein